MEQRPWKKRSFDMFCSLVKRLEASLSFSLTLFRLYGFLIYEDMLIHEVQLTKLEKGAKILHIGAGSLPFTAYFLAKQGFLVEAIDHDAKAVRYAQNIIRKLGYDDKIQVRQVDGTQVDVLEYDAIWISLHVAPKDDILDRLEQRIKKGSFIVYREPRGWLHSIYVESKHRHDTKTISVHRCRNKLGKQSVVAQKV